MTDSLFENDGTTNTETTTKYDAWELEALKTKAMHADNHIKTLESEMSLLRENKNTEAALQEVLKKLDQANQPPENNLNLGNNQTLERINSSEQLTKQDVLGILEQKQKELQAKANVDTVKTELQKVWGDSYTSKLNEKSKQLGISQDWLASVAETHPQAFLKIVLDAPPNDTSRNVHVPPGSTGSNRIGTITGGETQKDFRAQEKANPRLIHDVAFQTRKHAAAQRLGDAFFN